MKYCPNCGHQIEDDVVFCPNCGVNTNGPTREGPADFAAAAPAVDPYDHTAEFNAKDISDNKVFAMLVYLGSYIGILIALIACKDSPYVGFHIRQGLKINITTMLLGIIAVLLAWTIIVPIACLIMIVILGVISVICFFQVCSNKAKEPAIVRSLSFLK